MLFSEKMSSLFRAMLLRFGGELLRQYNLEMFVWLRVA